MLFKLTSYHTNSILILLIIYKCVTAEFISNESLKVRYFTKLTNEPREIQSLSIKKNYSEMVPFNLKAQTKKPFQIKKLNPLLRVKNKIGLNATLASFKLKTAADLTSKSDWSKIKLKLKSMSREKTAEIFTQVLNDAWSVKTMNYADLRKGRSESDTKAVINYMIMALYRMKLDEQPEEFDSIRFFDQVIYNPAEVSPDGLFEKDIVLSKDQAYMLFSKYLTSNETTRDRRKVVRNAVYRWPLPIYYHFDGSHNDNEKTLIKSALKRWEEDTCIDFKPVVNKNQTPHYMRFFKGHGCWSPVGYSMYSQSQDISIGAGCFNIGTVMHEVGHTLGFFHEQSRPDRDDHIKILRKNIAMFNHLNFEKYSDMEVNNYEIPYDLASDMHYGSSYFSSNSQNTIVTVDQKYQRTIGQRLDLSFSDIKTANSVYCKNKCANSKLKCERNGYPNPKNCQICLCPDGFSGTLCEEIANSTEGCGGLMTENQGIIETPSYPLIYPNKTECNWLIKAPVGFHIKLTFSKLFSTSCDEFSQEGPCDQDWLEIRDTNANLISLGGARYCCNYGPSNIEKSTRNELLILFKSTSSNQNSNGFRAIYEIIDQNGLSLPTSTTLKTTATSTTTTATTTRSTTTTTPYTTKFLNTTKNVFVFDYCELNPCLNGGSCEDEFDNFKCACLDKFTGERCENMISSCYNVKCFNGGFCQEESGKCSCPTGFKGDRCESIFPIAINNTMINPCSSNPCEKGVCAFVKNGYKCYCLPTYTGKNCEINLRRNICKTGICMNSGRCTESFLYEGFVCECQPNFNGVFCENKICLDTTCGFNGTCLLDQNGGYYCRCSDGSIGSHCKPQSNNICNLKPCVNGECTEITQTSYTCECQKGFAGKNCEIALTSSFNHSCNPNPCLNGGICFEKNKESICFCPPGYVGLKCDQVFKIKPNICDTINPCKNGKCINLKDNNYTCLCDSETWIGKDCDMPNPCLSSPCGTGFCTATNSNTFNCKFNTNTIAFIQQTKHIIQKNKTILMNPPELDDTYFDRQSMETNFCQINICLNGATCILDKAKRGMKCDCKEDYDGVFCENYIPKPKFKVQTLQNKVPTICDKANNKKNIKKTITVTTLQKKKSFFIIQDDLIWYFENNLPIDFNRWPLKLSNLFPTIQSLDVIMFDSSKNEYLIFKDSKLWKFKSVNISDPMQPNILIDGYPKFLMDEFGLDSVQGGFYVNNFENDNFILFFKESKMIKYSETNSFGIYNLPFAINSNFQFAINTGEQDFSILLTNRLLNFFIDHKTKQVKLKSIETNLDESFFCKPFGLKKYTKSANYKLEKCPNINQISSITRINSTSALLLTKDNFIRFINVTENGFKFSSESSKLLLTNNDKTDYSLVYKNETLFVFKLRQVWIYSLSNSNFIRNEKPVNFSNIFPNRDLINSLAGAYFNSNTNKFYFFADQFYVEYEAENKLRLKNLGEVIKSNIKTVISHFSNNDIVYLIDSNDIVYSLNLKTDSIQMLDQKNIEKKLFIDC